MIPTTPLSTIRNLLGVGTLALALTGWGLYRLEARNLQEAHSALSLSEANSRLLREQLEALQGSLAQARKQANASTARVQALQATLARRQAQDIKRVQEGSLACFAQAREAIWEAAHE